MSVECVAQVLSRLDETPIGKLTVEMRRECLDAGGMWNVPEKADPKQVDYCQVGLYGVSATGKDAWEATNAWIEAARRLVETAREFAGRNPAVPALLIHAYQAADAQDISRTEMALDLVESLMAGMYRIDPDATNTLIAITSTCLAEPNARFQAVRQKMIDRIERRGHEIASEAALQ